MSWLFANGPGDQGSIPALVLPKAQKMVLDATLLYAQHYTVSIKGKGGQSREGIAPSPTSWCRKLLKMETSGHQLRSPTLLYLKRISYFKIVLL